MAKRESGIGTEVKWLEDKQLFCQRFGYKDKAGRNKVKAIYGKSKGEIGEKRKAWQKLLDAGVDMNSTKMTFGEWLKLWLDTYKKGSVEQTTFDNYLYYVNTHIIPSLGLIKMKDLTRQKIQEFINETSKVLAPGTLSQVRTAISNSLKEAAKDDVILKNPAIGLKIPKLEKDEREEIRPFSLEELKKIFAALEGGKYQYISYLAAFTGMRRGELVGVMWKDIDFKKKVIHVRQQGKFFISEKKTVIGRLKTDNAYRDIPINDKVIAALKKQKAWQAANKLELGEAYNKTDLVFTDEAGEILRPSNITNSFGSAVNRAKVDFRSFHHLRHTFASVAISAGLNVKAISMTLGHATIAETLDTYGHLMPGDNQSVTAAVANFLAGL